MIQQSEARFGLAQEMLRIEWYGTRQFNAKELVDRGLARHLVEIRLARHVLSVRFSEMALDLSEMRDRVTERRALSGIRVHHLSERWYG